ncbi:MAG: caspase family protein, partial [Elusimicrobia bacterium]|nr:caspase family protein [Elusimicrobiota bacterium]
IAAAVCAAGAVSYGLLHRAPAARPGPAQARAEAPGPTPQPEEPAAPPQRAPSESELRAMVQAEVQGALKPAARPEIGSEVDVPSYGVDADEARAALVVGIEGYPDLPAADFAAHDARAVRDHLLALGFPPRNTMLLTNGEATKGKMTSALNSWLPKHAAAGSTVFFYYSGHGAPDPATRQAYLVPSDGEAENLPDTAIPLRQVYAKLSALKARHVVVALDACFSGLGGRSILPKGIRPLVTRVDASAAGPNKLTILSASGPEQISGSLAREGHGTFTYFLLKGLNGPAVDQRGRITAASLFRYLRPQVEDAARLQNREQTPQLLLGEDAEVVLRDADDPGARR